MTEFFDAADGKMLCVRCEGETVIDDGIVVASDYAPALETIRNALRIAATHEAEVARLRGALADKIVAALAGKYHDGTPNTGLIRAMGQDTARQIILSTLTTPESK